MIVSGAGWHGLSWRNCCKRQLLLLSLYSCLLHAFSSTGCSRKLHKV